MTFSFAMFPHDGGRFAATAFDAQRGKKIVVRMGDRTTDGTIADVMAAASDGSSAEITVEVPDLVVQHFGSKFPR